MMMKPIGTHSRALLACALLGALASTAIAAPSAAAPGRTANELKARELFARVIGFKTSIGFGQVPEMAKYLAGEFRAAGFPEADIQWFPLGETGSLLVRYRGNGTGGKPILMLSHMDVVTARREDWQRDPFTLTEENGFFYGRGTFDIKESLVCIVTTLLRLKSEGFVPRRDLVLLLTGDEETTMDTARDMMARHHDLLDADFALNPDSGSADLDETTGKPIIYGFETAEKTYANYTLTVRNPGGHSAEPRADNAIYELAAALAKVQAYQFPVMSNETTRAFFAGSAALAPAPLGPAMHDFASDPGNAAAAQVLSKDSHYVGMLRTTCVATTLQGGHADNALPETATAGINCRIFPGVDPVLSPEMHSTGEVMGVGESFGEAYAKAMTAAGISLPERGTAFISVNEGDKGQAVLLARRLSRLGFDLMATVGTAARLHEVGLEVTTVFKVNEGRPNVADHIKQGEVALVINTPLGRASHYDEQAIRRAALQYNVPCVTTMTGAQALVEALGSRTNEKQIGVYALQDLHAVGASAQ